MLYLEIINKYLPDILSKIRQDIMDDITIKEFVENEEELNKLLDIQEFLVEKYLAQFNLTLDENRCRTFYKDLKVPYVIINRSLNLLKNEILKVFDKENLDKLTIYEFSLYFQKFVDIIAKVYLKKDIYSLRQIIESPFSKYLLFKSHIKWLEDIIDSILNDNMDTFPITNAKNCDFSKYLYYPESLMVCIDKNLCSYIEDLHVLIHKTANSFYLFYEKNKYNEAYFIFKDLKEQILKFTKLISELYFITFANLENSFFKLIELLQYSEEVCISMVDIKSLKSLNKIYGETLITKALTKLEEEIKIFIEDKQDKILVIRGITSNFYILNLKYTTEEYKQFANQLFEIINTTIIVDNTSINFKAIIAGIKIAKYSEYKEYEFIKMLNHLKKRIKKENKNILLCTDTLSELKKILNEKYNEKFIAEKIENKQIDIMFQPIYKTSSKELYTLEILGRIIDNDKLLPAGMFIDMVYDMNMIEKFDMLVLDKLLQKQTKIKKISNTIFLNISFQSLLNEEYMKKLINILETLNINIILELTEQKLIDNMQLIEQIHNKYNVYFAVDDFGSGYSSLQTVVNLVKKGILKILKIDGSLIQNIENDEYMKKTIKIISRLGDELNLLTVAEFVENQTVLDMMKQFKIDLVQGYYLSKPKTIEELIISLENI